jgi:hypothetical protein
MNWFAEALISMPGAILILIGVVCIAKHWL